MVPKHINTSNPIFYRMQEDFSDGINDAIRRMIANNINSGKVTCTLTITLVEEEIAGSHGILRMAKTPVFEHRVKASVSQGIQIAGEAQMRGVEVVLDGDGKPTCRTYGGQMTLDDLEDDDES